MTDKPTGELLTFPCNITIKVIGLASTAFEAEVLAIIKKHLPHLSQQAIQERPSKNNKYKALSITVHADSKAQLDLIYQDLTSSPFVLMAL
jgi:putative lipoic acid-binding regulatory protein